VQCNICGASVRLGADHRWRKDGYDILECRSCRTLFRAELPDAGALREIYGPGYFSDPSGQGQGQGYADYEGEEPNHRANALARLRLLERQQSVGRLLDVGCAAGFFLDEARQRGWTVHGVELASEMVAYARGKLDLDVQASAFAEAKLEPGIFDAITMWDYIEHSTDPKGDLRRAAALLRPGGILAVSTGDASSIVARISGSHWHLLTPRHHNFFFTRDSLQQAFQSAGFEVISARYASSRYSMHYLAHKLQTLADWGALSALSRAVRRSRFASLAVPINLYDITTLVGRRR
jgi:2-polyprenyl-3-methyl-5-hydroxy-6-metoxy-1,4-benzoquinol methylase